jgi:hypothetical protein
MNIIQARQILLVTVAGWTDRQQHEVIANNHEDKQVPTNKVQGKGIRFTDDRRMRPAVNGKRPG